MEPGKSRTKHRPDFARPRLVIEMDRLAARRDRSVHDVLSPAVSKTNRRRTDFALNSKTTGTEAGDFSRFGRAHLIARFGLAPKAEAVVKAEIDETKFRRILVRRIQFAHEIK